jgi:hypothetical protein
MSLFPDEDVLTKKIETWRGFIEKLPSNEDKLMFNAPSSETSSIFDISSVLYP